MATIAAVGQVPFTWEGTDRTGKRVKGKVVATSETAVRQELRRQGVVPPGVKKQRLLFRKQGWAKVAAPSEPAVRQELRRQRVVPTRVKKQSMLFRKQGSVKAADIAIFSRQMA